MLVRAQRGNRCGEGSPVRLVNAELGRVCFAEPADEEQVRRRLHRRRCMLRLSRVSSCMGSVLVEVGFLVGILSWAVMGGATRVEGTVDCFVF